MKEIIENSRYKFRAWVNNSFMGWVTEISTLNQYAIVTLDNDNDNNDTYCHGKSFRFSQIELMQYTGLKDKNGTEIYEGDILRVEHYRDSKSKMNYIYKLVVWREDIAQWYFLSSDGESQNQLHVLLGSSECDVIGNIHENPELLK